MLVSESDLLSKTELAKKLGVSRASLYYLPIKPIKDWLLKIDIEEVLHRFPSYGYRRISQELGRNKKQIQRVMREFGIKPKRRRRKPRFKASKSEESIVYPNLLVNKEVVPDSPDRIWASDFTYLPFQGKWIYLATIIDLFTREIVGSNLLTNHTVDLVSNTLLHAVSYRDTPEILHSDQGREYTSKEYTTLAEAMGIKLSMSRKSSPWENGYQESFYSHFKLDLGDPNRFDTLGELAYNIYRTIWTYNNLRIHSAFKKPPASFARDFGQRSNVCSIFV